MHRDLFKEAIEKMKLNEKYGKYAEHVEEQMCFEDLIYGLRQQKKEMAEMNRTYVSIPQQVEAIQWTGDNLMKIHRFLGDEARIKCSVDLLAINGEIIVPFRHFIIKHKDGDLMISPERAFLKRYIPAEGLK
jgi:hypothetical protein